MGEVGKGCGRGFASGRLEHRPSGRGSKHMSIKLGRFFGINLLIHWTFWLLPLWVMVTSVQDPAAGSLGLHLALLGALFGCVILHEYGHALTARLFGIRTRDISLYPIGGLALH